MNEHTGDTDAQSEERGRAGHLRRDWIRDVIGGQLAVGLVGGEKIVAGRADGIDARPRNGIDNSGHRRVGQIDDHQTTRARGDISVLSAHNHVARTTGEISRRREYRG